MELTRALSFHIPVLFLLGALLISSSTLLSPSLCMGGGTSWGVPIVVYTQCHSHAIRVDGGSELGPAEVSLTALLLDLAFWYVTSLLAMLLFHVTTRHGSGTRESWTDNPYRETLK